MENKEQRPLFLGFSSQKGGVGKSTLAEIVSSILYYEQGINLFVMDCDLSQDSFYKLREREKSIVYKVLDKVKEMGLTNLKIICNDAIELNEYFKDGEVSRIYLNFSDPWPKNRHAKRRLTYHTFLALYQQILNDEGDLHFKTDNRGLFAYSLESMSQFGMYFTKINLNLHQEDDGSNILTEYEKKFSDKGSRIYRMEAKFHSQK